MAIVFNFKRNLILSILSMSKCPTLGWTACWPIFAPEHQMMWDTQICIKIGILDFLDKYLQRPGHFRGFFAKI